MAMLTTVDNPYDPFTQWDDWFAFDARKGYHTPTILARLAIVSDELSVDDETLAMDMAIDTIVEQNVTGMYRKVEQKT